MLKSSDETVRSVTATLWVFGFLNPILNIDRRQIRAKIAGVREETRNSFERHIKKLFKTRFGNDNLAVNYNASEVIVSNLE